MVPVLGRRLRSLVALSLAALGACAARPGSVPGEGGHAEDPCEARPAADRLETFVDLPAGETAECITAVGTLRCLAGRLQVDPERGRDADACLHLGGGEPCVVELDLPMGGPGHHALAFHAERWTAREPFRLRILQYGTDPDAPPLCASDLGDEVQVGRRFVTSHTVELDPRTRHVSFEVWAPEGGGLLLDDLWLLARGPRHVGEVRLEEPVVPLFLDREWSPLARVVLPLTGDTGDLRVVGLELEGDAEDLAGLARLAVGRGASHGPDLQQVLVQERDPVVRGGRLHLVLDLPLEARETSLWLLAGAGPGLDLDSRLEVHVRSVVLRDLRGEERRLLRAEVPRAPLRTAVAVRRSGDDGAASFRIPALGRCPDGTLLAAYDVRHDGSGDLPADIDVGLRRSMDGGRTWEPQEIVLDMARDGLPLGTWGVDAGSADLDLARDGVGDPCLLVDPVDGEVFLFALWSHGDRAWHGSGPGLAPGETGQLLLVRSTDGGRSWGPVRNLTAEVKPTELALLLQGPGRGVRTSDGRLLVPAQYRLPKEHGGVPHSTVLWSLDDGATWQLGTGARSHTTESAVVELEDGTWMLNMRDDRGGSRAVATTRDGRLWIAHPSSRRALVEPVCNASLLHVGRERTGRPDGRLIFSNPAVESGPRRRISLRASEDAGHTWSAPLVLEERSGAGYSCLSLVDADTVGILYEGFQGDLVFQRLPLADLFPHAAASPGRASR